MQFVDRFLKCADCGQDFIFTAGEQLFFYDKQFKNDPKRCKLCKAKRAGLGRSSNPDAVAELPLSRTETRTQCSACGIETTVPFKPTQGRPVLCRSCFQLKRVPSAVAAVATLDSPATQVAAASEALETAIADGAAVTVLPPNRPEITMSLIAEAPVAVIGAADDAVQSTELIAAAAEAAQA